MKKYNAKKKRGEVLATPPLALRATLFFAVCGLRASKLSTVWGIRSLCQDFLAAVIGRRVFFSFAICDRSSPSKRNLYSVNWQLGIVGIVLCCCKLFTITGRDTVPKYTRYLTGTGQQVTQKWSISHWELLSRCKSSSTTGSCPQLSKLIISRRRRLLDRHIHWLTCLVIIIIIIISASSMCVTSASNWETRTVTVAGSARDDSFVYRSYVTDVFDDHRRQEIDWHTR